MRQDPPPPSRPPPPPPSRASPSVAPGSFQPHLSGREQPRNAAAAIPLRRRDDGPNPGPPERWRTCCALGMQVPIRTNSLEFEFAPNSHEFVDHSELEFATSNSNPP